MEKRESILFNVDWTSVFMYLALVAFGCLNVSSVSMLYAKKQMLWAGLGFILIFFIFFIKPKYIEQYAGLFYILSCLSLAGLFIFGKEINGARAWYSFGAFSMQPVEFSKIGISLLLANLLEQTQHPLLHKKTFLPILLTISVPSLFILLQPDIGSLLVFIAFFIALYREGLPGFLFLMGFWSILLFIISLRFSPLLVSIVLMSLGTFILIYFQFFRKATKRSFYLLTCFLTAGSIAFVLSTNFIFNNVLKEHQKNRINILFENEMDKKYRRTIGYNLLFSKTAISSGEFLGKGYNKGSVTDGGFVPEQHTDYIFSVVGEEWGFLGSSIFLIFYALFIARIYFLAERQPNTFGRVLGYCAASIFMLHIVINIGMVTGLIPTIGIPLPFFSYGGSSLWAFSILLFSFLRYDAARYNLME